jgi:hypothetical protein
MLTTSIVERNGAGLDTEAAAFWDPATDGVVTAVWESRGMLATVTIFAAAL